MTEPPQDLCRLCWCKVDSSHLHSLVAGDDGWEVRICRACCEQNLPRILASHSTGSFSRMPWLLVREGGGEQAMQDARADLKAFEMIYWEHVAEGLADALEVHCATDNDRQGQKQEEGPTP